MQIPLFFYKFLRGVGKKKNFRPLKIKKKNKKFGTCVKNFSESRVKFELFSGQNFLTHVPTFLFFFLFLGDENFFFPDPPQKFVEKQGYLHTLDHRPLKIVNYFPYIFENVTFGSTKPKKYIFENMGKIIHD